MPIVENFHMQNMVAPCQKIFVFIRCEVDERQEDFYTNLLYRELCLYCTMLGYVSFQLVFQFLNVMLL